MESSADSNANSNMDPDMNRRDQSVSRYKAGGLTGWLVARVLSRLRSGRRAAPRLALVERIALAPRQSVALIEAEGRRILVATSADGASAFYPLDEAAGAAPFAARALPARALPNRVSNSVSSPVSNSASRVSPRISW